MIVALDLGTNTGWATWRKGVGTRYGTEVFKSDRFQGGGMRYLRFKKWLTELKAIEDIEALWFEEVRRHMSTDAAHCYGGFLAILTSWCEHHQIPYSGVGVGTVKKFATDNGAAKKDQMIAAMVKKGFKPKDDNQADALAILLYAQAQK